MSLLNELHSLTRCTWGSYHFWLESIWNLALSSAFAPGLICVSILSKIAKLANKGARLICLCVQSILCTPSKMSANQALNVFVLLFLWWLSSVWLSFQFDLCTGEWRPVEANAWTGRWGQWHWHQIAWWHHFSWMIPPATNWLPLLHNKQGHSSISGSRSSICPATSWKPSRLIPFALSKRLLWLSGIFMLYLLVIKQAGPWALWFISNSDLSYQESKKSQSCLDFTSQRSHLKKLALILQVHWDLKTARALKRTVGWFRNMMTSCLIYCLTFFLFYICICRQTAYYRRKAPMSQLRQLD